jgi:catechol 2,3-dioxygenase-like lactoylglutathione lyase family enzyme
MLVEKFHHVAFRCRDAKETVDFYRRILGMELIGAIAEDRVPSTKEPDPYMHIFLDAGGGAILAFFELPNSPPMGRDKHARLDAAYRVPGPRPRRARYRSGALPGGRDRGRRPDRPHDLQVDLFLRSFRPSARTGGLDDDAGNDGPDEVGRARDGRGMVEDQDAAAPH